MDINLVNKLAPFIALLGFSGSLCYFVLIKLGLPKTREGSWAGKSLTFFNVLIVYSFFVEVNKWLNNTTKTFILSFLLILILPAIFYLVINFSSNVLNNFSEKYNGYYHMEETALLQFSKQKVGNVLPLKYVLIFDKKNEFVTGGYIDYLSDSEDPIQQISLISDYTRYDFDQAVKKYNDHNEKYYDSNTMIYDFNKELKIFCFNE